MNKYAIVNANVISGKENDEVLKDAVIVVEDGHIQDVTTDKSRAVGMKQIDLGGKYILPGLINMHVHLPGSACPKIPRNRTKKPCASS